MEFWVAELISAFSFAAILFLLSSGFSLIFGVMKIVNITHGSLYMFGGFVGVSIIAWIGSFSLAILASIAIIAALGLALERIFLRQYYREEFAQILITIGFALVFKDVAFLIWGGDPYFLAAPAFLKGSFHFGKVLFGYYQVFVILVAIGVAIGLWAFIERSTLGAKLRASVDDNEMASVMGINVSLVCASTFCLGSGLAALGGIVASPIYGISTNTDFEFLPLAFVVVIVGGMGSLKGVIAGSILVALVDNFGKALFPELSYFTLFAPMAIVLAIKPTGLFGRA
jgi:branched-chain amino acid transport system permease protein